METNAIALFGEAEKGEYKTAYFLESLSQLAEYLGHPPPQSFGLHCAVQALLYHRNILFFRVREEGYSFPDYLSGLHLLEIQDFSFHILAICLPGVGSGEIIHAMTPFCHSHHSVMIVNESDLYDYLTESTRNY